MKYLFKELKDLEKYGKFVLTEELYDTYLCFLLQESFQESVRKVLKKSRLDEEKAIEYLKFVTELIGKLYKNGKKVKVNDQIADKANDLRFKKVIAVANMKDDYFEGQTLEEFKKDFEEKLKAFENGKTKDGKKVKDVLTNEQKSDIRFLYQNYIDRFDTNKYGTSAEYYSKVNWRNKPKLWKKK